jgi:hypothetical protein
LNDRVYMMDSYVYLILGFYVNIPSQCVYKCPSVLFRPFTEMESPQIINGLLAYLLLGL